jgi:hypothetical protein
MREDEEVETVMGTYITSVLEKLEDLMAAKGGSSLVGGGIGVCPKQIQCSSLSSSQMRSS